MCKNISDKKSNLTDEASELQLALRRNFGISIEKIKENDLLKMKLQQVPRDKIIRYSNIIQQIPGILSNKAVQDAYSGAYRMIIPPHIPANAIPLPRKNVPSGVIDGTFIDPITGWFNGKALWAPIENSVAAIPQIA